MAIKLSLPVGHPSPDLPPGGALTQINDLVDVLVLDAQPFAPNRVRLHHRIDYPDLQLVPEGLKRVCSPWSGTLAKQSQAGLFTVEIPASAWRELAAALPGGVPVPRRFTFGPIVLAQELRHDVNLRGRARVSPHVAIGELEQPEFEIGFQDQNRYWIDPVWVMQIFAERGLWGLPVGAPVPFVANTAPVDAVRVARRLTGPAASQPFVEISSDALQPPLVLGNPPPKVPSEYLSFVSANTITARLAGLPAGTSATLEVEDRSHDSISTLMTDDYQAGPRADATFAVSPAADLLPAPADYEAGTPGSTDIGNGSTDPSHPLAYRFTLRAIVGGSPRVKTADIEQDVIDTIRQEYAFHAPPFQTGSVGYVPQRTQFAPPEKLDAGKIAAEDLLPLNAYRGTPYALNLAGLKASAEFLRREFERQQFELAAPFEDQELLTADILIRQGWTNPEFNEAMGFAIDSPSQSGFALDIAPFSNHGPPMSLERLVFAGREFLQRMRSLNPSISFADLGMQLLESESGAGGHNVQWIWRFEGDVLVDEPGPGFVATWGIMPYGPETYFLPDHLRIRWRPEDPSIELLYPPVDPYPAPPPAPDPINLILLAEEHPVVSENPLDDRLALDDVAESLLRYFNRTDPGVTTKLVPAGDPITVLRELGAVRGQPVRIKHLFTISHGFPGYLVLTPGAATTLDQGIQYPPDAAWDSHRAQQDEIKRQLAALYGDARSTSTLTTYELHMDHLALLPPEMQQRLHDTLHGAEGIFLLGCSTGSGSTAIVGGDIGAFALQLATVAGNPVFGTDELSGILAREPDGRWIESPDKRGTGPSRESLIMRDSLFRGLTVGKDRYTSDEEVPHVKIYRVALKPYQPVASTP